MSDLLKLLADVSKRQNSNLAIVSQTLFRSLDSAGELSKHILMMHVPSDPIYKGVIDELIRAMGLNPDLPVPLIYHKLVKYPNVHVQLSVQHDLNLPEVGSACFIIRP